jgi:hypothetical protein
MPCGASSSANVFTKPATPARITVDIPNRSTGSTIEEEVMVKIALPCVRWGKVAAYHADGTEQGEFKRALPFGIADLLERL